MESIFFKLVNFENYLRLNQEAEEFPDREESAQRCALLDAIDSAILDYDVHVREYEYQQHRKAVAARGIIVREAQGGELKRLWDDLFASEIPEAGKNAVHYEEFRWHLFSYEKLPALIGPDAAKAFEACKKGSVFVFFQHTDKAFRIENAGLILPDDFDVDVPSPWTDVYLFDPENRWTYIHTHEGDCGPYFLQS